MLFGHGHTQKNTDICRAEGQVLYFVRVRLCGSVAKEYVKNEEPLVYSIYRRRFRTAGITIGP